MKNLTSACLRDLVTPMTVLWERSVADKWASLGVGSMQGKCVSKCYKV
jgi:hypothetical protein